MLQPHTMARDVARDEAEDLAAVITGYLALRKSLIMEAAKLERTLRQHIDNPAMYAERRRTIARLRDTANACSFAAGGCEVSARAVAAFRAGGAF